MPNPILEPYDKYNQLLESNVAPLDWVNPKPAKKYDLAVIGAGAGGLVSALGAAGLGAKVALVERNLLGGDCLNVGCVPSKAILCVSHYLSEIKRAIDFGISTQEVTSNFPFIMERMRRIRSEISTNDSAARITSLGVDLFLGEGRFVSSSAIEVGGQVLHFKRAIIATGGHATIPEIPGIKDTPYFTNETIFSLKILPPRLVVLGGGPIGCELAQAFSLFGSQVTLLTRGSRILSKEDLEVSELVFSVLSTNGVNIVRNANIKRVIQNGGLKMVEYECGGDRSRSECEAILIAAGKEPNVSGINLEAARVAYDSRHGIKVDERLMTTNRRIFAVGDVCMHEKFTHLSDATARIAIQNSLFLGRKKWTALVVPRVTYTQPEVATVGLNEEALKRIGRPFKLIKREFAEVDRSRVESDLSGFAKVFVNPKSGKIHGATIVGSHAGEMINEITLAMERGIALGSLSSVIHPYPTRAEIIRQLGDSFNRERVTPGAKRVLRMFLKLLF